MKTRSKALLLTLCAVLLVAASMLGTMAYLTSTDEVKNTFTVGQVKITLDEAKVDENGKPVEGAARVKANSYKLLPGHTYTKDPTIHVDAVSEDSWIFVKVENGIAAFEAATSTEENGYKSISDQITANGWTALNGVANVYYKPYTKSDTGSDLIVFSNFKIADTANDVHGWASRSSLQLLLQRWPAIHDQVCIATIPFCC
jgi:predicted ribosomally synthesized peptide with SipW-like signal peptide